MAADRLQPLRDRLFASPLDRGDVDRSPGRRRRRIVRQHGDVRDARHQLLDPGRRHAAVSDIERVQMIERRETREAGVRYFRTIQIQLFEARHALQMYQPAIRDVRAE